MRTFAILLSCVLLVSTVRAQTPPKVARIGILNNGSVATSGHLNAAVIHGLNELGYIEGKNLVVEARYAEGRLDRLPELAQDLASAKIDVLVAQSALASNAARKAGIAVPIVFALAPDPVGEGFAQSLARPGGNMTGLTSQSPELAAKRLELVREVFPKASRIGVLYARDFPGVPAELAEIERAVRSLGKEYMAVEAKRAEDLEPALAEVAKWRADVLLVVENPMFFFNRKAIAATLEKLRLPAIYRSSDYVTAGGLMSYGANYVDLIRRSASYVDRILKGAKPGDLPIEQPVKFELVVNQRTAKAIGVSVPRDLLARADQVID